MTATPTEPATGRGPRRALCVIVALTLSASGCGAGDPGTVVVRDSAGVRIVENPASAMEAAERWTIRAAPSLRIGGAEGDSLREFTRIVDAVRLGDGRIVVADAGASELRAFDAEGRFLWRQGGRGAGPGQYRAVRDVWRLPGDSVAALDGRLRRVVVVDPEGNDVRTVSVEAPVHARNLDAGAPLGALGSRLVIPGPAPDRTGDAGFNWQVHYLLDPTDGSLDSLGVFPRMPRVALPGQPEAWPRFGWATHLAASDSGIYMGTGQAYEVGYYDAGHSLQRLIRWHGPDRTITDADREDYLDRYIERSRTPPGQEAAVRADLETIPEAERKPAYFGLRTDRAGNLWVRDLDLAWMRVPETVRWTVLDPEGRLIARADMPGSVLPLEIGEDYVLARWRDDADVQYVALFDLVKGGGAAD
jgi:hypothetical protein